MVKFFVHRPIVAMVISIVTVLIGIVSALRLPVAQFPNLVPPEVQVQTTYLGADALSVEQAVATPLEQQINGVDHMLYMYSTSAGSGQMTLRVAFDLDTDPNIDQVLTQMRQAIAEPQLPQAVQLYGITNPKALSSPLMLFSLSSPKGTYDATFLANYAFININDPLTRVPGVGRWPGVIKPGTIVNEIFSQEDWLPTLLAAAGEPAIVEKVKQGYAANGKTFKAHLDGYNFMPYLKGEAKKGPREEIFYFGQGGELNAVRWNDWKVSFAVVNGNIATGVRDVPGWPELVNLRADPYEKAPRESGLYLRWYADNLWLFVPVQQKLKGFLSTIPQYPFQEGSSLSAGNINYNTLKAAAALKRLHELESLGHPGN